MKSNNILGNYTLRINEMNDSSVIRDRREELGIFCYKQPHTEVGIVLFDGGLILAVNFMQLRGNHKHTYIQAKK